jgi:hypothetical protein
MVVIAIFPRTRSFALAATLTFAACSSNSTSPSPAPTLGPVAQVRAVHASPDAGAVDVYVYSGSARPSSSTVPGAAYPQITGYLSIPVGSYTVDVLSKGESSTGTAVASEHVSVVANTQYSIVVGGRVANGTLQFINFVEPAETAGQTALIVHHASPFVASAIAPVGVGVYDASAAAGSAPTSATEVFAFNLKNPSGPASSGAQPSDGEYFLSPLPSTLPAAVGFAAGAPSTPGGALANIAVNATPAQLASGLNHPTASQQTLATDTTSAIPFGAHVSIFAIDTATSARLIGTLDP